MARRTEGCEAQVCDHVYPAQQQVSLISTTTTFFRNPPRSRGKAGDATTSRFLDIAPRSTALVYHVTGTQPHCDRLRRRTLGSRVFLSGGKFNPAPNPQALAPAARESASRKRGTTIGTTTNETGGAFATGQVTRVRHILAISSVG